MSKIDQKEEFFDLPERHDKHHPDQAHKKTAKSGSTHDRAQQTKQQPKNKLGSLEIDDEDDVNHSSKSNKHVNPKGLRKVEEAENPPPLERHKSNVDDMEEALYKNQLSEYSRDVLSKGTKMFWKFVRTMWNLMLHYIWLPIFYPMFKLITGNGRLTNYITQTYEWVVDAVFGKTMASIVKALTRFSVKMMKIGVRALAFALVIVKYGFALIRGYPQREAQNVRDLISMDTVKGVFEAGKDVASQVKDAGLHYMSKYWNQLQARATPHDDVNNRQQNKRKRAAISA